MVFSINCVAGSDEELEDLKNAYLHGKGSMDWILEAVPFTHTDEEDRLRERLRPLMDSGEIPMYKRFTNENPKKVAARKRKVLFYFVIKYWKLVAVTMFDITLNLYYTNSELIRL